jgi:lysylphosphatidylglycerol synthetase-like protein (DUF2156 family)
MDNRRLSISVTAIFVLLNALVWLAFGVIIALDAHPALPDLPVLKGIMAFLSLAAAGILLGVLFLLGKRNRFAYFIALAFFAATALLTIFDDFGWADLVVLALNLAPIILLIKDRAWYLRMEPYTATNHPAV